MASDNDPAILVARFLRSNHYVHTLEAFLEEANLPSDAGASNSSSLTIEQIVQEKKVFDLAFDFQKLDTKDESASWSLPSPEMPILADLPARANVLQTSVERLSLSRSAAPEHFIIASLANRRVEILTTESTPRALRTCINIQDSPILSLIVIEQRYLICTSMSGRLVLYDIWTEDEIDSRKDHTKYAVKVTSYQVNKRRHLIATAGWDGKVFIYTATIAGDEPPRLEGPIASVAVSSNPEHIGFVADPSSERLFLVLSRRDSTVIQFHEIPSQTLPWNRLQASGSDVLELAHFDRQNLAPYANSWVAFTPSAFVPCPTDPLLMAAVTSTVPHMRLIIFRLLLPAKPKLSAAELPQSDISCSREPALQEGNNTRSMPAGTSQLREVEAQKSREADAIIVHCNTMAPQTAYSTPTLAWRPDGTGIWVNGDDGIVRGIETKSGKVIVSLKAHEPNSKIRCLWAGSVTAKHESSEWLASGGFDQKLIIWRQALEGEQLTAGSDG